ncbi:hypothetical protein [Nitratidesulfovibrio vulgaris]|uniref:Uncharacterized protein n=1 Tax=Nitratidesulfovibrio vulgaris (strain ATCC 29579 / DSM 644 / CCUG 34227 / NCIMB 8303 / VKM B-1760 / Hildenborough) TaxID=882 RepID=Q728C3_NITV2|nr:hypothetical protein [Nitratidesulfovibrio vulgaris]GEB79666.1 hypothetical protein DDE01_10810 [Desulfovibrio desulfuricans]HBW15625.1 hypothetical protein [Desulfovibrio sp.]AAS97153.1 hypothetical protein DVU_2681 [Nitratidesulfovibrio vulgaris str. Hildenborough]ADP87617.1 hypothetical protein Deval_2474 [Nitratidesulfovibrio vulgaris RCH1]WCB47364.1 hypothetical protein PH214_04595 [Nitratidesulfovibrio vulgaris]
MTAAKKGRQSRMVVRPLVRFLSCGVHLFLYRMSGRRIWATPPRKEGGAYAPAEGPACFVQ